LYGLSVLACEATLALSRYPNAGLAEMAEALLAKKRLAAFVATIFLFGSSLAQSDPERIFAPTRYEVEYPNVDYTGPARKNRVWRLQQQLNSGEVKLQWEPKFGYLKSLLKALSIDTDSQLMVFSRTSLQIEHISPQTPRALYFNDDTYVGYVQNSPLIELAVIDADKGAVFYGLENRTDYPPRLDREGSRCLTCHDTFSMSGGGVPRVLALSSPVDHPSDSRTAVTGEEVDDRTPFGERWGGWYVTGNTGRHTHLGNLPLKEDRGGERLRDLQEARLNLASLREYFDTSNYLSDQSDVVALAVMEHQTGIHNLITRVTFKIRTIMSRSGETKEALPAGAPRSWADVSPADADRLHQVMEPLVQALFFQDAAPIEERMAGASGFAERFSKLGPSDAKGRSLRQLDLQTRLLRYPLSFEIYSEHFDAMPPYALAYVNARIVEILEGRDKTGISARLSFAERKAIAEILIDTKPSLAVLLRARASTDTATILPRPERP
jgi:hypothetical protein